MNFEKTDPWDVKPVEMPTPFRVRVRSEHLGEVTKAIDMERSYCQSTNEFKQFIGKEVSIILEYFLRDL